VNKEDPEAVIRIEQVKKNSVMNYQSQLQLFLKLYVSHPKYVSQLRVIVEKGISIGGEDCLS